jgi:KUP system potassium uptake protein
MKAILGTHTQCRCRFGGISAVFGPYFTNYYQVRSNYFLSADNHGEGGIFALYALVKKNKMVNCALLLR